MFGISEFEFRYLQANPNDKEMPSSVRPWTTSAAKDD
jgi:hypothetical protein